MTAFAFLVLSAALLASCSAVRVADTGAAPTPPTFDGKLVARGAQLAALGNCASCHTAPGGKPYAGGRALKTPFGTIYGTNITPDPGTGIGRWSEAEFTRAMREGLDREERHLYPAFPYDHFTHVADDDIRALYAFIMTRQPIVARPPTDRIAVPRAFVGIWNSMYLERGVFQPDPKQSAQWNRGAYLVEGLAHCSACHTPRNALGAEKRLEYFAGGEAEGWHAPALNTDSPSPVPWTAEALYAYLRTGIAHSHALTAGPMADVLRNLEQVPDDDVRAIATYIASLDARPPEQRAKQETDALAATPKERRGKPAGDQAVARGATIYAGACAECHDRGRSAEGGALRLPLATGLAMPTPRNLIRVIRDGILREENERGLWMPGFAGALTDEQVSDLVLYLRALTDQPRWRDVPGDVRRIARGEE